MMIGVDELLETLRGGFEEPQALVLAQTIAHAINRIERDMVRGEDFRELTRVVRDLAKGQQVLVEVQRRTEEEVKALAEAQRRTEERLEALTVRVETLAEAQRRTEEAVKVLAEAQQRTEKRLDKTNQMLAGVSDTVGYRLEDEAMEALPYVLQQDFSITLEGYLERKHVQYPNGRMDEVNILGEGRQGEQSVSIVGEAKSQLGKKHLDDLAKKVKRLQGAGLLEEECVLLAVTYSADPVVEAYARELGVQVYRSFELRRVAEARK